MKHAVALIVCTLFATIRFFRMVDRHAVDILFRDQWSIREAFFTDQNLWQAFRYQHGPHRQGLGALFIAASDALSGWNIRVEAFATGTCIVLAALVALAAKRRLSGSLTAVDSAIPFLFLGYALFELFAVAPNPAHGALPLLLATCAAWVLVKPQWLLLSIIGVLASHTAFALYLAIVLAGVAFIEALKTKRWQPAFAGVAISASLVYLFTDYIFDPAVDCFKFPHDRPLEYAGFLGLYLLRPFATFRLSGFVSALGTLTGLLALATSAFLFIRYLRAPVTDRRWPIVITLFGMAVSFGVGSALGRVCSGVDGALVSRYVPYAICAWLAAYLMANRWWALALCIAFFAKDLEPTRNESIARAYSAPKQRWRECYLRLHDWRACDVETQFPIHLVDEHLDQSFEFLRERRLNVYRLSESSSQL